MFRGKQNKRQSLERLVSAANDGDLEQVVKLLDRRNALPKPALIVEALVLLNPALAAGLWERGAAFHFPTWWAGSWPAIVERLLVTGHLTPDQVVDEARVKLPTDMFATVVFGLANMLLRADRLEEAVALAPLLRNPFLAKAVEVSANPTRELLNEARGLFALDGAVYSDVLLGIEAAYDVENGPKMLGSAAYRSGAGPFRVPQLLPIPDPGAGPRQLMLVRSELEVERGPQLYWQFVVASCEDEAAAYVRSLNEFAQEDERKVSRVSCKPLFTVDTERSGLALLWNDSSRGTQILRSVTGLGDRQVADLTGMAELRLFNELLVREPTSPVIDALHRDREKWPVPIDCPLVPDVYQRALDTGLFD